MKTRSDYKNEEIEAKSFNSTDIQNLDSIAPARLRRFSGTFSSKPAEIKLTYEELNSLIANGNLPSVTFFSLPPETKSDIPITQNITRYEL